MSWDQNGITNTLTSLELKSFDLVGVIFYSLNRTQQSQNPTNRQSSYNNLLYDPAQPQILHNPNLAMYMGHMGTPIIISGYIDPRINPRVANWKKLQPATQLRILSASRFGMPPNSRMRRKRRQILSSSMRAMWMVMAPRILCTFA